MRRKHSFVLTILSDECEQDHSFCGKLQPVWNQKATNFQGIEDFQVLVAEMIQAELNQEEQASQQKFIGLPYPEPGSCPGHPA